MRPATFAAIALGATAAVVAQAEARDQITIVGSSTVFPFTTAVAESFARTSSFPAPIVESTGTGGGMQLFCGGIGEATPDFTGASRPMRESEFELCRTNGVTEITEIVIGFDGIVLAHSRDGEPAAFTEAQIFAALAKDVEVDGEIVPNPYTNWSQIDPSLPDEEIMVFGPPPTSGTRDAWVELVMLEACEAYPAIDALEGDAKEAVCSTMREDGRFIEAGENDNLIVQRLGAEAHAYGIFGFSFLDQNGDTLQGATIDGVEPTFENIAAGAYPVARSLFLYAKNQHMDTIPGMREFIAEYTNERAWGPDGYLADKGLIPLPDGERESARENAVGAVPMASVR
jgi:phosphate transport system substrate-binding protein